MRLTVKNKLLSFIRLTFKNKLLSFMRLTFKNKLSFMRLTLEIIL